MGWLILAAYVGGFLFTYRKAYLFTDADMPSRDAGDRGVNAAMAMLVASVWPIAILGYVIFRGATPVTPREKKAELDARERQIETLERELGIGPHAKKPPLHP